VTEADDPGWRPALVALVPFIGPFISRRRSRDGLTALRSAIVGLVAALFLFVVSLSYIVEGDSAPGSALLIVGALGIGVHAVLSLVARRELSTSSPKALADSWRARMFIGVGFVELPALAAFAASLLVDTLWVYLLGMAFSLFGFWKIVPSKRNLERDQAWIRSTGSDLDLTAALMSQPRGSAFGR
jgi:hypothetical protein